MLWYDYYSELYCANCHYILVLFLNLLYLGISGQNSMSLSKLKNAKSLKVIQIYISNP